MTCTMPGASWDAPARIRSRPPCSSARQAWTVALAAQAVPLAWFAARSGAGNLLWATKGVLAVTVLRLSLNPWLESYSSGTHWAVWAYGGSTLACFLASRVALPLPRLRRWTEAAGVQLLVLTLWAVPRSWIYDGSILAEEYSLAEASFNTVIWAALGMAYYWRSRASEHVAARLPLGVESAHGNGSRELCCGLAGAQPVVE